MLKVYIQQAERTKAYKKTELSLVDLLCEPAQKILSKVDPSRIEGVFVSVQNISSFTGEGNIATKVADRLGLRGAEAERVETASNGHTALLRAFDAVASGRCKRVLAVGGEKMSAVAREERTRIIGEVVDPIDRACGLTMPSAIALISLEYARINNVSLPDFQALLEKKSRWKSTVTPCATLPSRRHLAFSTPVPPATRPVQSSSPIRRATSRFPAWATQSTVRVFSTAIILTISKPRAGPRARPTSRRAFFTQPT